MFRIFILVFILVFYTSVHATTKEKIITNLEQTNNISFNFKQSIDKKNEKGNCIIK